MKELLTVLNNILTDKNTNLKPGNLKKGVTCLGVTGTLETSTTSGGIKQFSTVEEMNASTGNTVGDLAIVYRNVLTNMTADTETQYITFPDTVVLPTAFTGEYYGMIRAVDDSGFQAQIMLSQTSFEFMGYSETGETTINYTSTDGITYTRSTSITNPVDLGTAVKSYYEWNDNIGYFMQTGGMYFDGLYDFRNYLDKDYFRFIPISNIDFTSGTPVWNGIYTSEKYSVTDLQDIVRQMKNDGVISKTYGLHAFIDSDNDLIISEALPDRYIINSSGNLIGMAVSNENSSSYTYKLYKVNLDNHTYSLKSSKSKVGTLTISNSHYGAFDIITKTIQVLIYIDVSGQDTITRYQDYSGFYLSNSLSGTTTQTSMDFTGSYYDTYNKYQIAPSQITATPDYVYEKEFYGKNGTETGILTTNISKSFADTNAAIYNKVQQAYNNMTPRVLTNTDKTIDRNIYFIPTNSNGTVLLDTSKVTDMNHMFASCDNLVTIPLLNTSNVTKMSQMFSGCDNLTEVPLLNTSKVTSFYQMFDNCHSLTSIPAFDTSNVTEMNYCFSMCTSLVTLPVLNTSKVKTMPGLVSGCSALSDDSLNNILKMCINTTSAYNGFKTLKTLELNYNLAAKCKTLSNYSAFTAAGWKTGWTDLDT